MTSGSAPGPPSSLPLPQQGFFLFLALRGSFPHLLSRGTGRHTNGRPQDHLHVFPSAVRIFSDLWSSPRPAGTPHAHTAPPPPLSPRDVTPPLPLFPTPSHFTFLTLHIPFTSLHIPVIPPCEAHIQVSPPRSPKRVQCDLPFGAAPCAEVCSHPPGYSPHVGHGYTAGWRSPPT